MVSALLFSYNENHGVLDISLIITGQACTMKYYSSIAKMLNPQKIAVIGASDDDKKVGGIVFKRLTDSGRKLYPVNPKSSKIQGYTAYQSIKDLPDGIDLVVVTVSAKKAVDAVRLCAEKKIPHYIIVAGGFSEVGKEGLELELKLKQLAIDYPIHILGPNSLGVFLPNENMDTIFVDHGDKSLEKNGTIACIVQSGSMGVEALGYAANTGYGMRAFVGLGNKCHLTEMSFLNYFSKDEKTRCIGFYLESIESGRTFLKTACDITLEKPIVVLKAGQTHTGAQAATSHTGKLAGIDNVVSGAFRQYGIQRVYDDEEFCDATKILSRIDTTPGNRVAVLTGAGGYGVMCADFIEKSDVRAPLVLADLEEKTREEIRKATFDFASCNNPVDITASADDQMFAASLDALIRDPNVDMVICIVFFSPPGISPELIKLISKKNQSSDKPVIVFTKYGPYTDAMLREFFNAGVVGYPSLGRAVRAARILVERSSIIKRLSESALPRKKGEKAVCEPESWLSRLDDPLCVDEYDAKKLMEICGIKTPVSKKIEPDQPLSLSGVPSPFVLKICTGNMYHKTDHKAVLTGLAENEVPAAFKDFKTRFPGYGMLLEQQVHFEGPEMIIGVIRDPVFGLAVMVGAGGTLTEIYRDFSFRLVPCPLSEAFQMISELSISNVFDHFRGMDLDRGALAETIVRISELAQTFEDRLKLLDINPIVFSNGSWVALDVKIAFEKSSGVDLADQPEGDAPQDKDPCN